MSKPPIPRDRQEDVLHMLWILTQTAESKAEGALDRMEVESAYNLMNQIGYSSLRPSWERGPKKASP